MHDIPTNACRERHVKVAVRLRPLNDDEKKEDESNRVVAMTESAMTVQTGDAAQPYKEFHFDTYYRPLNPVEVYPEFQEETIMNDIGKPICRDAFRGYNGCVIAYGQTGSGKTHTIMGTPTAPGLLRRCVQEIFHHKARTEASGDAGVHVWISFVELYSEKLRDLLVAGPDMKDMQVVDHPMLGSIVPRRIESPCESLESTLELIDYATKKRIIGCTTMNATSTQSHAMCTIRIVTKAKHEDQTKKGDVQLQDEKVQSLRESITMAPVPRKDKEVVGKHSIQGSKHDKEGPHHAVTARINFVDLAGSERVPKSGPRGTFLSSRRSVNFSLQALHLVIEQLKSDKLRSRIAFNSSKLTSLLRDALGGNCRTRMIATISPMRSHREETLTTLDFAEQMMGITCLVKVNMHKKIDLRDEINRLTAQYKQMIGAERANGCFVLKDDLGSLLKDYEFLEKRMKKTYKGRLAEEEVLKADRKRYLEELGLSTEGIETLHGERTTYLTNISTDSAFTGCLVYYLKDGSSTTVGNTTDSDIVLRGLGMRNFMCIIKTDGRKITLCMNKPRPERDVSPKNDLQIRVNGELCKSEEHILKNMDVIYFGKAMALRLCLPNEQCHPPKREQIHDDRLAAHFSTGDSPSFLDLRICVGDLRDKMGTEEADALVAKVAEMAKLVDEGNDIAWEMRTPEDRILLEVELVWDVNGAEPEDVITIRVTQLVDGIQLRLDPPPYPTCLFFWTVAKFLERLELMRQKYDEFMHRQYETNQADAETPCFEGICNTMMDPWLEPTVAEISLAQYVAVQHAIHDEYDFNFDKETLTRNASARSRASVDNARTSRSSRSSLTIQRMSNVNDHSQSNCTLGRLQNSSRDLIARGGEPLVANGQGSQNKASKELAKAKHNTVCTLEKQSDLIEMMEETIKDKNRAIEVMVDKVRKLEETLAEKNTEQVVFPQKTQVIRKPASVLDDLKPVLKRMTRSTILGTRLNPPVLHPPVLFPPRRLLAAPSAANIKVYHPCLLRKK